MSQEKSAEKINAVEKTLHILNALADMPYIYSAKELSEKLGFSKPTIHRILNTLEEARYVRRTFDGKYAIGYKTYQVGSVYATGMDIYMELRRVVERIAKVTGQQVGYAVLDDLLVVSIYESQIQDSRVRYLAGEVYQINAGCYGKILMTFSYTDEELQKILPEIELRPVVPGAITDWRLLLEEYRKIRVLGYNENEASYTDPTVGLGVPVFRKDGRLHGCLAIGALKSQRLNEHKMDYIDELLAGARELNEILV